MTGRTLKRFSAYHETGVISVGQLLGQVQGLVKHLEGSKPRVPTLVALSASGVRPASFPFQRGYTDRLFVSP